MREPHVVAHVAVTRDGAATGFAPGLTRCQEVAVMFGEDVTFTAADAVLAHEETLAAPPRPRPRLTAPAPPW